MTDMSIQQKSYDQLVVAMRAWLNAPLLIIVALTILFGCAQPNFLTIQNFANITIQASYLTVFALAQTYVVIVRGFDLSLGTSVSLISVASSMAMMWTLKVSGSAGAAIAVGVLSAIGLGLLIGAVNGIAVSYLRLNPFVVTLATLNICLGFASTISGGFQIFNLPDQLNQLLYQARPIGIPAPAMVAIVMLAASYCVFRYTQFGRVLFFIGSNPRAAEVAGLPVRQFLLLAYLVCSALIAVGAIMLTARTGSGEPNLGGNLMLESIGAAVVGGASLRGGRGGIGAPLLGGILITVLSNGMNLTRIDGYIQQIILGLVVLATVFADAMRAEAR